MSVHFEILSKDNNVFTNLMFTVRLTYENGEFM